MRGGLETLNTCSSSKCYMPIWPRSRTSRNPPGSTSVQMLGGASGQPKTRSVAVVTNREGSEINVSASAASPQRTEQLDASIPESRRELCDSGLPDVEMCDLEDMRPPQFSAVEEAIVRGKWLLGLLIVQSTSSFVLSSYEELLRDHIVVTLFLTMLVGAGGNAGNQSAIKVIRGLATGAIDASWPSMRRSLAEQSAVGLLLGTGLSAGGFARVYVTNGSVDNAGAISLSLFLIVMTSVVLGSGLPFILTKACN
ncbi:hypothetical protein DUNSADRAFT_16831 [Dunaliella salina]|uniref:SLC41A/MgtE integral membrane domain-containing protein n=1 Tax=Dunaliella salina TaxID=3046 RepID=A0ABQ7G2T6_DUNSA|nr:hypothetical protein DUNSADRAFT_16831 [Dunaliella salina]|eukprot:KAF5828919.1 hypothetical protein DUNSADRAFT_16831 [Dunaliella salina]